MKQSIINQLEKRKRHLLEKQKDYNVDFEDREIKKMEDIINELVTKMNSKNSIFDGYQKNIDKIEMTIQNVNEIIEE